MNFDILDDYQKIFNAIYTEIIDNKKNICNGELDSDADPTCSKNNCSNIYTLTSDDFICYITPADEHNTITQTVYLKNIYEKIVKASTILNLTGDDINTEDKEDKDKSVIEIFKKSNNKKKK